MNVIVTKLIVTLIMFCLSYSEVFTGFSQSKGLFKTNDYLVSTLGIYRMNLDAKKCQLIVFKFDTSFYLPLRGQNYAPVPNRFGVPNKQGCQSLYLDLRSGSLCSNPSKNVFMNISHGPVIKDCARLSFTIDDTGIIRLTCLVSEKTPTHWEQIITTFHQPNKYIYATSNIVVNSNTVFKEVVNDGGWSVEVSKGRVILALKNNKGKSATYKFDNFIITPNSSSWKNWTIEENLKVNVEPRCNRIGMKRNLGPYVFTMHNLYPLITFMDLSGHIVAEMKYPFYNCYENVTMPNSWTKDCQSGVCPPEMFLDPLMGCVIKCEKPLFHELDRGINRCVIKCQQSAFVDLTNRICRCRKEPRAVCPPDSEPAPIGCQCREGFYLNGVCIPKCPPQFLGQHGICLSCPRFCDRCRRSGNYFSYFACQSCQAGTFHFDNHCYQSMMDNKFLNGFYPPCQVDNCVYCPNSELKCDKCSPISTWTKKGQYCQFYFDQWSEGCQTNETSIYNGFSSFKCIPKNKQCNEDMDGNYLSKGFNVCIHCSSQLYSFGYKCLTNCSFRPDLYENYSTMSCQCRNNFVRFKQKCLNISACPINMFLHSSLRTCFSCPIGCTSCRNSFNDLVDYRNTQRFCTSCAPDYILDFNGDTTMCILNSILVSCVGHYEDNMCLPSQLQSYHLLCLKKNPLCRICQDQSETICNLCFKPYVLNSQGKCIEKCPSGTFVYNGVCILQSIEESNCQEYSVRSVYNYVRVTKAQISASEFYNYYTAYNQAPVNVVTGHLLLNSNRKNKTTLTISEGALYCHRCRQGYGINMYGFCQKCPFPCATCYQNRMESCYSCASKAYQMSDGRCATKYKICTKQQFRNPLFECIQQCDGFYIEQNNLVNCTLSCPKGSTPYALNLNDKNIMACGGRPGSYTTFYASVWKLPPNRSAIMFMPDVPFENKEVVPKILMNFNTSVLIESIQDIYVKTNDYLMLITQKQYEYITLDLTSMVRQLVSKKGSYASQITHSVKAGNSYREHLKGGLFWFGVSATLTIMCLHVIYIGNFLPYRADNSVIFLQTVGLLTYHKFPRQLELMRFFYGFQTANLQFFLNFIEPPFSWSECPRSFRLLHMDSNILRTTGSIISYFVAITSLILLASLILTILNKFVNIQFRRHLTKYSVSLLGLPILCMTFYSMVYFRHLNRMTFNNRLQYVAIVVSSLYLLYVLALTIYAWCSNSIFFWNQVKKVLLGIVMAFTIESRLIWLILLVEFIYALGRIFTDQPYNPKDFIWMSVEQLIIILAYSSMLLQIPLLTFCCLGITIVAMAVVLADGLLELSFGIKQSKDQKTRIESMETADTIPPDTLI